MRRPSTITSALLCALCLVACSRSHPKVAHPPADERSGSDRREPGEPGLPDKPDAAELEAGIRQIRSEASKCGAHTESKTRVTAKIRIEGATGTVRDARILPPHDGTALGDCVAAALTSTKFTRFRFETVAVVFPLQL